MTVGDAGEVLFDAQASLANLVETDQLDVDMSIRVAEFRNDAGIVGAAIAARDHASAATS